jgi:HlyD family secretion protein
VFVIVPETTRRLGRVPVTAGGVGKVSKGQTVRIKFDDFPYKEFGMVNGTVEAVSLVARQGQHMVTVSVPSPLVTHYGKTLPFKQEMTGAAAIITEDRRLIGRLFNEFHRLTTEISRQLNGKRHGNRDVRKWCWRGWWE